MSDEPERDFSFGDGTTRHRPDDPEPIASELLAKPGGAFSLTSIIEKWESRTPARDVSVPLFVRETMPNTVEREDFGLRLQVREYELSPHLMQDLRELAPQALLRDLHRPVQQFYVTPTPIEGTQVIGQLNVEFEKLRETRALDPLPRIDPTVGAVIEEQRRRRDLMAERWLPIIPDDAPRRDVKIWNTTEGEEEIVEAYRPDFSKYTQ